MLEPLNDGHVELEAKVGGKKLCFTAEKKPRFYREFTDRQIKQLFKTTEKTLVAHDFGRLTPTEAWMLPTAGLKRSATCASSSWRTSRSAN